MWPSLLSELIPFSHFTTDPPDVVHASNKARCIKDVLDLAPLYLLLLLRRMLFSQILHGSFSQCVQVSAQNDLREALPDHSTLNNSLGVFLFLHST